MSQEDGKISGPQPTYSSEETRNCLELPVFNEVVVWNLASWSIRAMLWRVLQLCFGMMKNFIIRFFPYYCYFLIVLFVSGNSYVFYYRNLIRMIINISMNTSLCLTDEGRLHAISDSS